MKRSHFLLALAFCSLASPLFAQDIIRDVDYVSGRDGLSEKAKGILILSEQGVRFTDRDGKLILDLPIATVVGASEADDIRDASFGKKMLFGGFAGTRKQEFLTVQTETSANAEALIFKLKQHTAAGAVAKINFYKKKSGSAAAPDSGSKPVAHTNPVPQP
jgi:hypothetical protein